MKGLDVVIIRLLPFVLFILFCVNVICCACGYEAITILYELHSNSLIYALSCFLISLSNKKYHCVWNRAMYVFLMFVPLFNFIDALFGIIPHINTYLIIMGVGAIITCIVTSYLAINHFVQLNKIRKEYGREQ